MIQNICEPVEVIKKYQFGRVVLKVFRDPFGKERFHVKKLPVCDGPDSVVFDSKEDVQTLIVMLRSYQEDKGCRL